MFSSYGAGTFSMTVDVCFGYGWLAVVQVAFEVSCELIADGMLIDAARC